MNYLHVQGEPYDIFSICQAYNQLESDFNKDGWVHERPSNKRRMESIGCQLSRIGFSNPFGWVNIVTDDADELADSEEETVRFIYIMKALQWGLPLDEDLKRLANRLISKDFLAEKYPHVLLETAA